MSSERMLRESSIGGVSVRRVVNRHIRNLLFSGIVLAAVLTVVAITGLVNEIVWIKYMMKRSAAQTAVEQGAIIAPNLFAELELRIKDPSNTDSISQVHVVWSSALELVEGSFNEYLLPELKTSIENFNSSTEIGEILFSYIDVLALLMAMVYLMLQHTYSSRAFATTESLSLSSTQAAIGSLLARESFVAARPLEGAGGQRNSIPWQSGSGLFTQYVVCNVAPIFSTATLRVMDSYLELISLGYEMYADMSGYDSTSKTVKLLNLNSINQYITVLKDLTEQKIELVSSELQRVYLFGISSVLIIIALVVCCIIFCRYYRQTKTARLLCQAFENQSTREHLHEQYLPVLQDLRAVSGIGKRTNELDRVYSIAASWLDVMRTVTPQLMFGRADGKASAWAVTARKARFSVGHHYECPQVVVMEVTIGMHADDALPMNERPLPEQLELLNAAQNVVVTEVNRAGGIVLGTRGNISMVALWNTTWTANNAAVLALRTAYTIHYCLQQVRGLPASVICLATGPFVVGKIAAGERRYACALSTTLSYLRVMKNVGSSMGCAIVMDRSTSRRLPLVVSRQLKPVVVLRLSSCEGGKNYVVYSCNDKAMKNPEQAAHYLRGFTLYQNNLLTEARAAFERYLSLYPDDISARWLFELVVQPRFFSVTRRTRMGRSENRGSEIAALLVL